MNEINGEIRRELHPVRLKKYMVLKKKTFTSGVKSLGLEMGNEHSTPTVKFKIQRIIHFYINENLGRCIDYVKRKRRKKRD